MSRNPLSKYRRVYMEPDSVLEISRSIPAYIERDGSFTATQLHKGDCITEDGKERLWLPAKALPARYV